MISVNIAFSEIESLCTEQSLLTELMKYEKTSTTELLVMFNMHIFPSSEVGMIRKDVQALNEKNSDMENSDDPSAVAAALQQELQVAEKKAIMLRSRRLDEERIVGQNFADIADDVQYSIDVDSRNDQQNISSGGAYRKPARDSGRF